MMGESKVFEFRLGRKLAPAPSGSPGMIFRGITTGAAEDKDSPLCTMNVNTRSAEGNKSVREAAGFFNIAKGDTIKVIGKGKSVSVCVRRGDELGFDKLMSFASTLPFANTDALDFIEFYNKYLSAEGQKENLKLSPSMSGLAVTSLTADEGSFEVSLSAIYTEPLREDDILGALRQAADDYDVGIILDQL